MDGSLEQVKGVSFTLKDFLGPHEWLPCEDPAKSYVLLFVRLIMVRQHVLYTSASTLIHIQIICHEVNIYNISVTVVRVLARQLNTVAVFKDATTHHCSTVRYIWRLATTTDFTRPQIGASRCEDTFQVNYY